MTTWRPLAGADGDDGPRTLRDSLDQVTRELGLPTAKALHRVFESWPDTVGPDIAAHARPVSLRHGRLVIAVDDPGWATQLRYLESDLIQRLCRVAGDDAVTAVDVRVRPPRNHG